MKKVVKILLISWGIIIILFIAGFFVYDYQNNKGVVNYNCLNNISIPNMTMFENRSISIDGETNNSIKIWFPK